MKRLRFAVPPGLIPLYLLISFPFLPPYPTQLPLAAFPSPSEQTGGAAGQGAAVGGPGCGEPFLSASLTPMMRCRQKWERLPSRSQSTGDQLLKAKEKKKKRNQSILKAAFGQDPLTSPIPGVRISGSLLSPGSRGFALGGEEEHGGEEGRQRKLAERFPRATCFLGACRSRRSGPIIIAIMTLADARGGTACRKPFSALHVGAELTSTAVSSGGSCYSLMSQPRVVKPRDGRPPDPGPAAQR